ncbi:hypothetical protein RQP46_005122 [Phenoliferia psychrophenolica]
MVLCHQCQPSLHLTRTQEPKLTPIFSLLPAAAPTAVSNSGVNPLIPTTLSTGCTRFLEYLNTDTSISTCATPLRTALSLFAPSTATTYSASGADVASSLATLCSTAACSDSLLRETLSHFNGNCSAELTAGNEVVVDSYDAIYTLGPFLTAICTKDSVGDFCLSDIVSGRVPTSSPANATSVAIASASALAANVSSSSSAPTASSTAVNNSTTKSLAVDSYRIEEYVGEASHPNMLFWSVKAVGAAASRLLRRQDATNATSTTASNATSTATTTASTLPVTGVLVNATTFATASIPFLLLSTNMTSTILCTPCTKSILAPYVSFEARSPYALGLANSKLLGHQGALWQGIAATCGQGFVSSIATMAGETSGSLTGAAGSTFDVGRIGAVGTAFVAVLAVMLV